jgi:neural Wiskott-Aldrich syndrome protein
MPSILTSEDITKIKRILPKSNTKILVAVPSKLYIAYPDPKKWTSTGLSGILVLTKDIQEETCHFKLVDVSHEGRVSWDFEFWNGFVYFRERPWFHSFEMDGFMGGLSFVEEGHGERFYRKVLEQGVGSGMSSDDLRVELPGQHGLRLSRDAFRTCVTTQHKGLRTLSPISGPLHFKRIACKEEEHATRSKSTTGNTESSDKILKLSSDEDIYWAKAFREMRIQRTHSGDERLSKSGFESQRESKRRVSRADSPSPPPLPPRRKNLTPPSPPPPAATVLSPSPNDLHSPPSVVSEKISKPLKAESRPSNSMDGNIKPQESPSIPKPPSPRPPCSPPTSPQLILSQTQNPPPIPVPDTQGRSALLASIRLSGGVGALKKVVPSGNWTYYQVAILDPQRSRSRALEGRGGTPVNPLAKALAQRKSRIFDSGTL